MKFGKYLKSLLENEDDSEWIAAFLDYNGIKKILKDNAKAGAASSTLSTSPRTMSLSVQRHTSGKESGETEFYNTLDAQLKKISDFIEKKMVAIRQDLRALDNKVQKMRTSGTQQPGTYLTEADRIGQQFMKLEKWANVQYRGLHKIIKKHDKLFPTMPCRYTQLPRLHAQPWAKGEFSDVLVQLSNIYSILRGDRAAEKNEDTAQGFVRSTTKYWVAIDHVSSVKYHVLQYLPVFQFNADNFAGDAQLINSAYYDNDSLELYHGRLDKKPGAIALRMRWYGTGQPKSVFVERKTHRDSWKGEESVKERIMLPEDKVVPFLEGEYTLEDAVAELRAAGKSDKDIGNFSRLFSEIYQQVDTKQLHPLVRTQYMRTAFQIPHDSTVRISLDTNLVMIKENPDDAPPCSEVRRWYRDPEKPPKSNEITRFPHAVLEVKLSLREGDKAPDWVQSLLDSGYLTEVHKFSKFLHGTSTLLPDMVQALPYWVDEQTVRDSILASQTRAVDGALTTTGAALSEVVVAAENDTHNKPRRRAPNHLQQSEGLTTPLLHGNTPLRLMPDADNVRGIQPLGAPVRPQRKMPNWFYQVLCVPRHPMHIMRMEPKTVFANERTYLSWLHMAVTIGSTAAALLGFANLGGGSQGMEDSAVAVMALIMLPLAVVMCGYAIITFLWRGQLIARKQVGNFDDRIGPLVLAVAVLIALGTIMALGTVELAKDLDAWFNPSSSASPPSAAAATLQHAVGSRLTL